MSSRMAFPSNTVVQILKPNVGRESRIFLHHIVTHYNVFGKVQQLFFLQENELNGLAPFLMRRSIHPHAYLSGRSAVCHGSCCEKTWCWKKKSLTPAVTQVMRVIGTDCPGQSFPISLRGGFAIAGHLIGTVPLEQFRQLYHFVLNTSVQTVVHASCSKRIWTKQNDKKVSSTQLTQAEYVGHAIERLWHLIFKLPNCTNTQKGLVCGHTDTLHHNDAIALHFVHDRASFKRGLQPQPPHKMMSRHVGVG